MTRTLLLTEPGADPVVVESVISAGPERVFHAWTRAEDMRQWFGSDTERIEQFEIDLRIGGHWSARFAASEQGRDELSGRYTEIVPNERLAFTWQHHRVGADGTRVSTPESLVTITFCPEGSATRLHLEHTQVQTADGRAGVGHGWDVVVGRLQATLESAHP